MRSLDGIVDAKSEILECVDTAVVNVDAYGLQSVADAKRLAGGKVVECSALPDTDADVRAVREDGPRRRGCRR